METTRPPGDKPEVPATDSTRSEESPDRSGPGTIAFTLPVLLGTAWFVDEFHYGEYEWARWTVLGVLVASLMLAIFAVVRRRGMIIGILGACATIAVIGLWTYHYHDDRWPTAAQQRQYVECLRALDERATALERAMATPPDQEPATAISAIDSAMNRLEAAVTPVRDIPKPVRHKLATRYKDTLKKEQNRLVKVADSMAFDGTKNDPVRARVFGSLLQTGSGRIGNQVTIGVFEILGAPK